MKVCLALVFVLLFSSASANEPTLLVLGDSLSAAFGIDEKQGWVSLLQTRINQENRAYKVINASISGETSAGGVSRLPVLLNTYQPDIVILALGANDGLRGLSLNEMRSNLASMINQAKSDGAKVLLVGMQLPPNYGPAYIRLFHDTFLSLAEEEHIPLVPFLLEGVGGKRELFQPDGLHPIAQAQARILDNVWHQLEKLL